MYRYSVVDTNTQDRAIALQDPAGRYHVARSTSDMPSIGSHLEGELPHLGSSILLGRHGQVFTLIFDMVNASQGDTFDRLHAPLLP